MGTSTVKAERIQSEPIKIKRKREEEHEEISIKIYGSSDGNDHDTVHEHDCICSRSSKRHSDSQQYSSRKDSGSVSDFTATKSGDNVAYTLNSAYEGFFKNNTRISGSESLTGEALSDAAYNYVKTQVGTDGSNGAAFAKEIMKWILENTTIVETTHTTATTTAGTTVIDNLAYGYYVVYPLGATDTSTAPGNETVKSVASLVSVTGDDATVNMKSNYPTVDKKLFRLRVEAELQLVLLWMAHGKATISWSWMTRMILRTPSHHTAQQMKRKPEILELVILLLTS